MSNKGPLLIGFLGYPGSGKTTFARQLADALGAVTYNSDALRLSMFGSEAAIEKLRQTQRSRLYEDVFGGMNYAAKQSLKAGYTVIYDAQMTKRRNRDDLTRLAHEAGGEFVLVWVKATHEVAIQRSQFREADDDSHRYSAEKSTMLVERFSRVTDMPEADENLVEIDGEVDFEEQYRAFENQLDALLG